MSHDLITKKLEQMKVLLKELAERNFQLIIELASDINAYIIAEKEAETPDTHRESFKRMSSLKVLKEESLPNFIKSSNLRNILIHEYDFDEDNFIFYKSAKEFLPLYDEYINSIQTYLRSKKVRHNTQISWHFLSAFSLFLFQYNT